MMRIAVIALAACAACGGFDYGGTDLACVESPVCPNGFTCVAGVCRDDDAPSIDAAAADADPLAPDAAAPGDAAPDAAIDFCDEAASRPNSEACSLPVDLTDEARTSTALTYGNTAVLDDDASIVASGCPDISLALSGPDAVYVVHPAVAETVTATLVAPWNSAVYLADGCGMLDECFHGDRNGAAVGDPEVATHTAESTDPIFIVVDSAGPSDEGCFQLTVTLR
jgi:hypothetical protein